MKIVRMTKRELQELAQKLEVPEAGRVKALSITIPGKQTIYLPYKARTKAKLHEIYHTMVSPLKSSPATANELALEELGAEHYTLKKMGKDVMSTGTILEVAATVMDYGYSPRTVASSVNRGLVELGYEPLSKEARNHLLKLLREYHEGKVGTRYKIAGRAASSRVPGLTSFRAPKVLSYWLTPFIGGINSVYR